MKKGKSKTYIDSKLNKYVRVFSDEEILAWKREDAIKLETKSVRVQLKRTN